MYSFESRGNDCVAIDEPLYREWLLKKGDAVARPYCAELVNGVAPKDAPEDADIWARELPSLNERIRLAITTLDSGGVIFLKHMGKHSFLYDFDNEYSPEDVTLTHRHLFLIRDPVDVLSAWGKVGQLHGDNPTSDEVGIVPLLAIYSKLESRRAPNSHPVVLESDELVSDPAGTLAAICEGMSIPYRESMLAWKSGPHACDGPWGKVGDPAMYASTLLVKCK
jgi:hypothetical protein